MIHTAIQSRIAGVLLSFVVVTLAGGCASMNEAGSGQDMMAVNPAATSDDVSAQRGWLFPGPRGVAPCPMENVMSCTAPASSVAVNGGV